MNYCHEPKPGPYHYGGCPQDQGVILPPTKPKPCPTVLDFAGVALAILEGKREHGDLPADVRVARAVRVLSELVTLLEQGLLLRQHEAAKPMSIDEAKKAAEKDIKDYYAKTLLKQGLR